MAGRVVEIEAAAAVRVVELASAAVAHDQRLREGVTDEDLDGLMRLLDRLRRNVEGLST